MRAPADQADAWKPVCDIIRQSLKINPEWLAVLEPESNVG
jgi:hypothetical protein